MEEGDLVALVLDKAIAGVAGTRINAEDARHACSIRYIKKAGHLYLPAVQMSSTRAITLLWELALQATGMAPG